MPGLDPGKQSSPRNALNQHAPRRFALCHDRKRHQPRNQRRQPHDAALIAVVRRRQTAGDCGIAQQGQQHCDGETGRHLPSMHSDRQQRAAHGHPQDCDHAVQSLHPRRNCQRAVGLARRRIGDRLAPRKIAFDPWRDGGRPGFQAIAAGKPRQLAQAVRQERARFPAGLGAQCSGDDGIGFRRDAFRATRSDHRAIIAPEEIVRIGRHAIDEGAQPPVSPWALAMQRIHSRAVVDDACQQEHIAVRRQCNAAEAGDVDRNHGDRSQHRRRQRHQRAAPSEPRCRAKPTTQRQQDQQQSQRQWDVRLMCRDHERRKHHQPHAFPSRQPLGNQHQQRQNKHQQRGEYVRHKLRGKPGQGSCNRQEANAGQQPPCGRSRQQRATHQMQRMRHQQRLHEDRRPGGQLQVQRQQEQAVENRTIPAEIMLDRLRQVRAGVGEDQWITVPQRRPQQECGRKQDRDDGG